MDDIVDTLTEGNTQGAWLNTDVVGLGLNRFLSDLGHEAGTAILPAFLVVLGAPPLALGTIEAVSDDLSSFAKLLGGWLGDRLPQRRPLAAVGYALTGITTGLYGFAASWLGVLIVRALGWVGRGLRSPLHDALLTDAVTPQARGRAFGFDEACDTLGAIVGPLAALAILTALSQNHPSADAYRITFLIAMVPGILAALCILFLVHEKRRTANHELTFLGSFRALPLRFRRYLGGIAIFGSGDFSHTLFILFATQLLS